MKFSNFLPTILSLSSLFSSIAADTNTSSSQQILNNEFKPPQVFKNVNLLRIKNLEKSYVRETINVVIENIDSEPQSEYYILFEGNEIGHVGGLEVRDKKRPDEPAFTSEIVGNGSYSSAQYYIVHLPTPLSPKSQQTLSIKYNILSQLRPKPASIPQTGNQHILYEFSSYVPSAYETASQKTRIKVPTTKISPITGSHKPESEGRTLTYGPFSEPIPAFETSPASIRYEYTHPLLTVPSLHRLLEVSQWGGNLATEESYDVRNRAANLTNQFSRVTWQMNQYYNPPTTALKDLLIPLERGTSDAYFTDDVGNVSTSNFRPGTNTRNGLIELKPRYPVFGGWKYTFKVGWNSELSFYLRSLSLPTPTFVLKVPFLEGPKVSEGISYEEVEVSVVLPEGARNVKFETEIPITGHEITLHKTFMDTIGRTQLKLRASNVIDEDKDKTLIVTYEYPAGAMYRKPLTVFASTLALFGAVWLLSCLDTSIGKKAT
ncbi:MAG: dolichyl-diphosphooligosaccharide--protein glycosyltransferase subunit 1 [Cirrosporium novae-zelandiae]|nr:MAG: dolichyl-diphosphooligosaccharide--protein glycosyltransferase subunit 1 [Cirrosporium novae-zelandiae]